MVDPSLLRLAADRGVTICFADLDGADGLWVPEERTVLVNRRLSESEVAEVIEHELGHAAIDDQHADLDAGMGGPGPARSRRRTIALTVAAFLAAVGGLTAGLTRDYGAAVKDDRVVAPGAPPLTGRPPGPGEVVVTTVRDSNGRIEVRTVTLTPTPAVTSPVATSVEPASPTATRRVSASAPAPPPPSPTAPPVTTSPAPATTAPDPTTTAPDPTTSESPAGTGDSLQDSTGTGGPTAGTDVSSSTP